MYRKKPVDVSAIQIESLEDVEDPYSAAQLFTDHLLRTAPYGEGGDDNLFWVFDYLHNTWVSFELGDYILKGVKGEHWPVKQDVFEATYKRVGLKSQ